MTPRNPQDPGDRRNPWTRPGSLAAAALLGAIAILAIILIATSGGGTNHHTQTQASNPTTSTSANHSSTTTTAANPTGCTLPAGDQTIPSASPPTGTSWAQVGSMSAPQAPSTLGPQRTNGPWNTCFAHSPSGALLSVINFIATASSGNPGQVLRHLAVGVPAQLPACNQGGSIDDSAGGDIQLAGYRYSSYSPGSASVVLALKAPKGLLAVALTSVWTNSDWRVQYPPSGCASATQISTLDGYVPWSQF